MYYHIHAAECLKDYYVHLKFEDGLEGIINFEKIVGKGEAFGPLKDMDYFCRMKLDETGHTIEWPNGADICPEVLYDTVRAANGKVAVL